MGILIAINSLKKLQIIAFLNRTLNDCETSTKGAAEEKPSYLGRSSRGPKSMIVLMECLPKRTDLPRNTMWRNQAMSRTELHGDVLGEILEEVLGHVLEEVIAEILR